MNSFFLSVCLSFRALACANSFRRSAWYFQVPGGGGSRAMDFDVVEDSRPRFQLQSGPSVVSDDKEEDRRKLSKVQIGVCVGVALLLLSVAWMQAGLVQFLAAWLALALLVGPFAPSSATGGDCRVGMGGLVPEDTTLETTLPAAAEATERRGQKGYGSRKRVANAAADRGGGGGGVSSSREGSSMMVDEHHGFQKDAKEEQQQQEPGLGFRVAPVLHAAAKDEEVEKAWSGDEIELLKKQLLKHPRGTLQRWEVIAEALGGAHRVESVIKMSKLLGDKKFSDGDSYANFLAQRKSSSTDKGIIIDSPLSQRSWEITTPKTHNVAADLDTKSPTTSKGSKPKDGSNRSTPRSNAAAAAAEERTKAVTRSDWTEGEDKALLSALKAFPKDSAMRWDKVAEAMPGRSKAQCFRRFSDLRETFRSAKTDSSNPGSSDQVVE